MNLKLTVNWWNDENREFTEQEQAILKKSAIKRAEEMIQDGYICGELHETLLHFDPASETEACGWWEYKETSE